MKSISRIALSLVAGLTLTACGGAPGAQSMHNTQPPQQDPSHILQVGYAQVDISPTNPIPMNEGGEGSNGMSTGLLDYLYANCVYLTDQNGTELYLMAFDLCNMYSPLPEYRLELAKRLGVAEEQLMFSASHTHSSVNIKATKVPYVNEYLVELKDNLEAVALKSKADAKPVTGMFHTATQTEGLNFVRRYIMEDGSYAGDNYGNKKLAYAAHESDGDRQLQLLKFTREGGKDVILTNFQTHPHRTAYDTTGNTGISSDIVGVYRQELERQLDCLSLYYTGSSGNVNPTSKIQGENIYKNHREHGKAMAQCAVEAAGNFKPLELGQIQIRKVVYKGICDHTEDNKLEQAKIVAERYNSGMGNTAALEGYRDLFEHSRHALSVISKAANPETRDVPLYVFSIGDFAACYAPFELFAELGVSIKAGSPFPATFVCCYSNYIFSYMPTELAFSHGGYGPYKCNFVRGTGEQLVSEFLAQLESLRGEI